MNYEITKIEPYELLGEDVFKVTIQEPQTMFQRLLGKPGNTEHYVGSIDGGFIHEHRFDPVPEYMQAIIRALLIRKLAREKA